MNERDRDELHPATAAALEVMRDAARREVVELAAATDAAVRRHVSRWSARNSALEELRLMKAACGALALDVPKY